MKNLLDNYRNKRHCKKNEIYKQNISTLASKIRRIRCILKNEIWVDGKKLNQIHDELLEYKIEHVILKKEVCPAIRTYNADLLADFEGKRSELLYERDHLEHMIAVHRKDCNELESFNEIITHTEWNSYKKKESALFCLSENMGLTNDFYKYMGKKIVKQEDMEQIVTVFLTGRKDFSRMPMIPFFPRMRTIHKDTWMYNVTDDNLKRINYNKRREELDKALENYVQRNEYV